MANELRLLDHTVNETRTHSRWVGKHPHGRHIVFKQGRVVKLSADEARSLPRGLVTPVPGAVPEEQKGAETTRDEWDDVVEAEPNDLIPLILSMTSTDELQHLADAETRRGKKSRKAVLLAVRERIDELVGRTYERDKADATATA